jgi:hypothetical protein
MERPISRIVRISREGDEGQKQRDIEIVKLLSRAGIVTCGAYMVTSALVLRKAGLDALDMDRVMNCIAENLAPTPVSASALMGANSQVSILSSSSSSSYMDTEVGNIFSAGHVTELCGPNLVGKTLLCVDLTVRCIINSLLRRKQHVDAAAVTKTETACPTIALYVDIKKKLNSKSGLQENVAKIVEDCATRRHHHPGGNYNPQYPHSGGNAMLPTIGVEEVVPCFQIVEMDDRGAKGLLAWLRSEELQMELSTSNVACIVIDSLTALLPTNNKGSSISSSSSSSSSSSCSNADEEFAVELSYLLRRIAEACACPVVITTAAPQGQYVHCEELYHGPYRVRILLFILLFFLFLLVCDVSVSLLSIHCSLLAFSGTT